jgi:hypothetical protein
MVKVSYWLGELPLEGADIFEHDLHEAYSEVSVESAPGGLGGGLYTLFVEITASITLSNLIRLVLDGVAFDLIKLGARNLILRPLLAAQRKLKERNTTRHEVGDLAVIRIIFIDSIVTVDADSRVNQSIADSIGEVLRLLAENYELLLLSSGDRPIEVYIPVIEDTGEGQQSRFRAVLEIDEEMHVSDRVFFEYWGLSYSDGSRRVYDVERKLLLDEYFLYRREYWDRMSELWKQRGTI